jgi:formylmethanofuran dehydrogenase subunit E
MMNSGVMRNEGASIPAGCRIVKRGRPKLTMCCCCGERFREDETIRENGEIFCPTCYDEIS